jgi:YD repeat-containing protein
VLKTPLDDKTTLGVNAASGDLTLDTSLFNIKGVGLPLNVDQTYDSMGAPNTSFGSYAPGSSWSLSPSFDQPKLLIKEYNYPQVADLIGSNGTNAAFTDGVYGQFPNSPPGLNAILHATSSTNFALTFNQSHEVWNFTELASNPILFTLTNMVDRNGNTISFTYDSTGTKLASITDTEGRTVTIAYNALNLVGSITDSRPVDR